MPQPWLLQALCLAGRNLCHPESESDWSAAVAKTYQMMLQLFGLVRNQKSLDDPVSGIRQQRYCSWAAFVNPQTVRHPYRSG